MSGSFPVFDAVIEQLVNWIAPVTAADLGAGSGKFGRLIGRAAPTCRCVAVETDPMVVERHELAESYDQIHIADASHWLQERPDLEFDLIVAGDVLQQLSKSAGLDLLNSAIYQSSWILLVTPEFVRQGSIGGRGSAVHRSVWSERDMHWHDLWAWDNVRSSTLTVLRGYRSSGLTIDDLVQRVNGGNLPLLDYDAQTAVRPCRLRLVDHSREVAYRPR